jgi:predicted nuclease with RNAse H fold
LNRKDSVWIGADPGGKNNFGLAILHSDGSARTFCVDCTDEAIQVLLQHLHTTPTGVGVDAPLWWSSGRSGDREADQWLRKRYHFSGGQVQTANSLRGAALVQGAMFVQRIRDHFPGIGITETHPKAVLKALGIQSLGAFAAHFRLNMEIKDGQEHERDALISAVAAREGFERRWLNDLSASRHPSEQDPSLFWLAPIHYYWPDS